MLCCVLFFNFYTVLCVHIPFRTGALYIVLFYVIYYLSLTHLPTRATQYTCIIHYVCFRSRLRNIPMMFSCELVTVDGGTVPTETGWVFLSRLNVYKV